MEKHENKKGDRTKSIYSKPQLELIDISDVAFNPGAGKDGGPLGLSAS